MRLTTLKTLEFEKWFKKQNPKIKLRITARLDLISIGHLGDHKRFDGLIELRWKNGIRIYSFRWKNSVLILLKGGNKSGQKQDIQKAKKIREEILEGSYSILE